MKIQRGYENLFINKSKLLPKICWLIQKMSKKKKKKKLCNDLANNDQYGWTWKITLNRLGQLSTAYALQNGGWASVFLLFGLFLSGAYTSHLLVLCLGTNFWLRSYADIGFLAFGNTADIGFLAFGNTGIYKSYTCFSNQKHLLNVRPSWKITVIKGAARSLFLLIVLVLGITIPLFAIVSGLTGSLAGVSFHIAFYHGIFGQTILIVTSKSSIRHCQQIAKT